MEIKKMLEMNYEQCCEYLKNKYGVIKGSYFINESYKSTNQSIKKTNEGLIIHHIDEDKAVMLSTPACAKENPWEYQLGERLVYCNLLEHLVLHIKIMQYPNINKKENNDVGVGGVFNFIIPELNDIYSHYEYKQKWRIEIAKQVENYKEDYFSCLKFIMINFKKYPLECFLSSKSYESIVPYSLLWNERFRERHIMGGYLYTPILKNLNYRELCFEYNPFRYSSLCFYR